MNKNNKQKNRNKFFSYVLFSNFFKIAIGFLILAPNVFFIALLFKLIIYIHIKDIAMVDEISDLFFKFGTPYALVLAYIINFGENSKKK